MARRALLCGGIDRDVLAGRQVRGTGVASVGFFLLKADQSGRIALLAVGGISGALFGWFHLLVFSGLTPYGVNVVYSEWNIVEISGGHLRFFDRYYRLWGLFVDWRFGIAHWAPILLLVVPALALMSTKAWKHRSLAAFIVIQLLIATFVAITMMGWWFPGRTMLTIFPLFVVALALLVGHAAIGIRVVLSCLGFLTLTFATGLAQAGHAGETTIAVEPFERFAEISYGPVYLRRNIETRIPPLQPGPGHFSRLTGTGAAAC